jgi:hypothetical protein
VWLAEVGDICRFSHPKKLCAYAGLGPSSGVSTGKANNNTNSTGFDADNFSIAGVPEPSSLALGGAALAVGAMASAWRYRRVRTSAV